MKRFHIVSLMLLLGVAFSLIDSFGLISGRTAGDARAKHQALQSETMQNQQRLSDQFEVQAAKAEPKLAHEARRAGQHQAVITWRGGRRDHHWNNPRNWKRGHVPGATDVARFAHSKSDVLVNAHSVGGLRLESGYRGTLRLKANLALGGDVVMRGGKLNLGDHSLGAEHYSQAGGTTRGGRGKLIIEREATVSGGLLITPSGLMSAASLRIEPPVSCGWRLMENWS